MGHDRNFLRDLDRFRRRDLDPWLEAREAERKAIERRVIFRVGLFFMAACAAIAYAMISTKGGEAPKSYAPILQMVVPAVGLLGLVGSLYVRWATGPLDKWGERLREAFYRKVFGHLRYIYTADPPRNLLKDVETCGILPGYDEASLEDRVQGGIGSVRFDLCDCQLRRKKRNSGAEPAEEIVFQGLIGWFSVPKNFRGETVILYDRGAISNRLAALVQEGKRVALESVDFEERFEVFSSDQVEARYLLSPAFMERLLLLRRRLWVPIQAAFANGRLYVAIDLGADYFVDPPTHSQVHESEAIDLILARISFVPEMAEILRLDAETLV